MYVSQTSEIFKEFSVNPQPLTVQKLQQTIKNPENNTIPYTSDDVLSR